MSIYSLKETGVKAILHDAKKCIGFTVKPQYEDNLPIVKAEAFLITLVIR